jgi:hypothetical protein
MIKVLLTILIIIDILVTVGVGIFGYVIYKKYIKPIMSETEGMIKDFKIPNQWKK